MRHCVDFVADSYTARELKYNHQIFMQKSCILALFHDPLAIRKWHCRDAPYSALAHWEKVLVVVTHFFL